METTYNDNLNKLKAAFRIGGKYTIFHIDSCMAMTHKSEIIVKDVTAEGYVFCGRGKRTQYLKKWETRSYASAPLQPMDSAVFEGWDQPITCDSDRTAKQTGTFIMRGNACYNFCAMPEEIAAWIETGQLNPFFERDHVLAIEGDKETVVFPEECHGGHAVIDRILNQQQNPVA